jgi:hypothetical protein
MFTDKEHKRRAAALKAIYRVRKVELEDYEATAIAEQLGNRPLVSMIVCVLLIIGFAAFLIIRFA